MSILKTVDEISSRNKVRKGWFGFILIFFLVFIIFPSIYVLLFGISDWQTLQDNVLSNPDRMAVIYGALFNSFGIALIVTLIDIIVGLPMAWIMVRKEFRGKKYLDTLIDMPLAFPTAALGFSVAIFWSVPVSAPVPAGALGWFADPLMLIILLHIIFTYPYMVRSLSAILEQIDQNVEMAGMTLGASRFTAVRTITLPLFRAGMITGFILCFARSLSETGGTYIALTAIGKDSLFFTGPTLIAHLKDLEGAQNVQAELVMVSMLLIVSAILLLFIAKYAMSTLRIPWSKVWPRWERKLSRGLVPKVKDGFSFFFMFLFVIIPSFFIFSYILMPAPEVFDWSGFFSAIMYSFAVAGIVTVADLLLGVPFAIYIARNSRGRLGRLLDSLVNIPLIIPTTALGFSLGLFWGGQNLIQDTTVLVILAHIAFTYPLVVRNVAGAVEEVDPSYEEAARTLGAKPFQAFRKVLLPIIKSSLLAGAILAFTRSLGETGATIAVHPGANTVPVYIVGLIRSDQFYMAAMSSIALILISFLLMFGLRHVTRSRGDQ
ncbi:MAG: ABC transporter permease subunit [Candidatus Methanomethylophilaceae archaeon]|nr:ABC transporter permease subunit [Candidatus Methanomethylophilaceae archaeon]